MIVQEVHVCCCYIVSAKLETILTLFHVAIMYTVSALVMLALGSFNLCRAQAEYSLVHSRPNANTAPNQIRLVCRDMNTAIDITDARFFLNMTRSEYQLRNIPELQATISANRLELTFIISKDYEGFYQCGPPDQLSVSEGVQLIGEKYRLYSMKLYSYIC